MFWVCCVLCYVVDHSLYLCIVYTRMLIYFLVGDRLYPVMHISDAQINRRCTKTDMKIANSCSQLDVRKGHVHWIISLLGMSVETALFFMWKCRAIVNPVIFYLASTYLKAPVGKGSTHMYTQAPNLCEINLVDPWFLKSGSIFMKPIN